MGWTFTNRQKGISTKRFFEDTCNYTNEDGSYGRVLDCKARLDTAYIAYEIKRKDLPSEVVGVVCLTKYVKDYYNFGYKDMDETMGPYSYDCPKAILEKLTPTTNEYALKWREKCKEKLAKNEEAKRLKVGDKILIGGETYHLLERRKGWWRGSLGYATFRITDHNLKTRDWEVVK